MHHTVRNRNNLEKEILILAHGFGIFQSITITVMTQWLFMCIRQEAERETGLTEISVTFRSLPTVTHFCPFLLKSHSLPIQCHQLASKCSKHGFQGSFHNQSTTLHECHYKNLTYVKYFFFKDTTY